MVSNNKYGSTPTMVDGVRFDSKAEAVYWRKCLPAKNAGEITILRQVSFDLPGGIKYRVDFLIIPKAGSIAAIASKIYAVEIKGYMTQVARIKIAQFRELYQDIPLHVLKCKDYKKWAFTPL